MYFNGIAKEGGIDFIIRYFRQNNYQIYIIEHPLEDFSYSSRLIINGKIKKEYQISETPPLRWAKEIFLNKKIIKELKCEFDFAFASDPLNFLALPYAKKNHFAKYIFLHSTDYSKKRFSNPILNYIYQKIYKNAVTNADMTTVVSNHVLLMAKKLAPSAKIKFLPNSPSFSEIPKILPKDKNKHSLVITVGKMSDQIDFDKIITALKILKERINNICLTIVGNVKDDIVLKIKKENLKTNIIIKGILPYEKAIGEVSKAYVGIVYYTSKIDHVKYGDSIKIREYAAAGLPTVCDCITSTSKEMKDYKAGFIVENAKEMSQRILELMENDTVYNETRNNALAWARKLDKIKLLKKLFKDYNL